MKEQVLVVEFDKENGEALKKEILHVFSEAEITEVNTFGADSIIQAIVAISSAAFASSTVATLIKKLIRDKNVSVKYDGNEISGDYKNVKEIIDKIESIKKEKKND